jgi:hypothetical protein
VRQAAPLQLLAQLIVGKRGEVNMVSRENCGELRKITSVIYSMLAEKSCVQLKLDAKSSCFKFRIHPHNLAAPCTAPSFVKRGSSNPHPRFAAEHVLPNERGVHYGFEREIQRYLKQHQLELGK